MNRMKKSLGVLTIVGLLVLSGCIKMTVTQTLETSGKTHLTVLYDATAMMESIQSMGEAGGEDLPEPDPSETQKACDDFFAKTTWENPTCVIEGYAFTMGGDTTVTTPAFEATKGVGAMTYRYDLKNIYTLLQAVGEAQGQEFSDTALMEQKDYVEVSGIELTYTLQMPGTITKTDVGTIQEDGSTVMINLFDMAALETAYVESEVKSTPWAFIVGGLVILVVLGGVGAMVMKKKKAKDPIAPTATTPVAPSATPPAV